MPSPGKSSSRAGIHPYMRQDFVWPEVQYETEGILCDINDEEFLKNRIDKCREKRTFYLDERLCKVFNVGYSNKGQKLLVTKHAIAVNPIVQNHWDFDHLKRWHDLKEDSQDIITLVNDGTSWWTAETIWIKAKI